MKPGAEGGGYWNDVFNFKEIGDVFVTFVFFENYTRKDDLKTALDELIAENISMTAAIYTDSGGGHAISVWGYEYDDELGGITGLLISDPDDDYLGSRRRRGVGRGGFPLVFAGILRNEQLVSGEYNGARSRSGNSGTLPVRGDSRGGGPRPCRMPQAGGGAPDCARFRARDGRFFTGSLPHRRTAARDFRADFAFGGFGRFVPRK